MHFPGEIHPDMVRIADVLLIIEVHKTILMKCEIAGCFLL